MFNIGRSRYQLKIETPAVTLDAMGSPVMSWAEYATVYGEVENDNVDQTDSTQTGPRREVSRSITYSVRCHHSQEFSPAMRVVSASGVIFEITAVRYNAMRTQAFIDVVAGVSAGGVP